MQKAKGFGTIHIVLICVAGAVILFALLAVGVSILQSGLRHTRDLARRMACASNCSALGKALSIYTSDPSNEGAWPWVNGTNWDSPTGTNRLKAPPDPTAAPDERAITSLLFVLVRENSASVKHFKCPGDDSVTVQADYDIGRQHDFANARNVSYSYAAPFPAEGGGCKSGASPDVPFAEAKVVAILSDRNPMHDGRPVGPWGDYLTDEQRRQRLSVNHHGEGINVVWLDFHVSTEMRADVGVQNDNIYSAGGAGETAAQRAAWRAAVSTKLADHVSVEDSFLVGPYEKK